MQAPGLKWMARTVGLMALALLATAPAAAAPNWEPLGFRVVNDRAETDTIVVGADEGRFKGLRVVVDDAPIQIHRVEVFFGNGETQVFNRDILVRENRASPVLDLRGGKRVIRKVEFRYQARSRGWEKATVRLLGRR